MTLDELDMKIVETLERDGRISIPLLAKAVGTSRATAYARFDRLVESGVLTGFSAKLNFPMLDLDIAALVSVSTAQKQWEDIIENLRRIEGVYWVALGTGRHDFVVLVRARDLKQLRNVTLDHILQVPGVTATDTTILLDEFGSFD